MTKRTRRRSGESARVIASVVGALTIASCAGDGTLLDPTGRPLRPPDVEVSPTSLDLSLLEGTNGSFDIAVSNAGGLPLVLGGVVSTAPFLQPHFDAPVTLDGGSSVDVRVDVSAGAPSSREGVIEIRSDDPADPVVIVPVALEVSALPVPEIDVTPAALDVTVLIGNTDTTQVTIRNLGSADLQVAGVVGLGSWIVPGITTARIAPSASQIVPIVVSADTLVPGLFRSAVEIRSDDEDEPIVMIPVDLTVDFDTRFAPTLSTIQDSVFTPTCALSFCHGASQQAGLHLADGFSFGSLVGAWSLELASPDTLRVRPGAPDSSYVIIKVTEDFPPVGNRMPLVGAFLTVDTIEVIRRWIELGAKDN